jgi:hypothetical protein
MKADFSGYATKAGLRCTDGRTIEPNAFKHQDQVRVPLVWQHSHNDPENVLGHAILENREDGVYAYGFFNDSAKAQHTKGLVEHGDITMMSIWANQLIERSKRVLHGAIKEVSLVLSGANPGAIIDNVAIRHSDGDSEILDDEAIIYTGIKLELAHADTTEVITIQDVYDAMSEEQKAVVHYLVGEAVDEDVQHADLTEYIEHAGGTAGGSTVHEIYNAMTKDQKNVVHFLVGEAIANKVQHADMPQPNPIALGDDETIQDIFDTLNEKQQAVVHYLVGEALDAAAAAHSDIDENLDDNTDENTDVDTDVTSDTNTDTAIHGNANQEGNTMTNVFEKGTKAEGLTLSHDDMKAIVADAYKSGSFKEAIDSYAAVHGITNIDMLFPDAQNVLDTPEFNKRRTEWVASFLDATRKRPFSRIKTIAADLTYDDARAKGYVKGALKKDEFFTLSNRITTPTTVYKKQKLDRDDMVDITDLDIVAWLKAEMRLMLDEEIARAMLIGDGRAVDHEDKIDEGCIRPIAKDSELFTTTVNVNIDDANSSVTEIIDAIIMNRRYYRGTGLPTFFTSETYISKFLLLKDSTGRRIYTSLAELANELRVAAIVPTEVMEDEADLIGVIVNPVDYVWGANKGGEINLFDDFDIDYNQYKYLMETRCCGALVKIKSALALRKVESAAVLVVPTEPAFNATTGVITIPTVTGVVYKNAAGTTLSAGAQTALASGASLTVNAFPTSGSYYFGNTENDSWTFTRS